MATQREADWYRFAEERVGEIIGNDSLYLITGLCKSRSWSLAAFEGARGRAKHSAQFKITQGGGNDIAATYSWETTRNSDSRYGPMIALRTKIFGSKHISVKVDSPSTRTTLARSYGTAQGSLLTRAFGDLSIGKTPQSGSGSGTQHAAYPAADDARNVTRDSQALTVSEHVVVRRVPEMSQAFHPSDIINQHLLNNEPSANMTITHDDYWIALLEKNLLKSEKLAQEGRFKALVSQTYNKILKEGGHQNHDVFTTGTLRLGVVYLQSRSGPASPSISRSLATTSGRAPDNDNFMLSWTNKDPREGQLFNTWGVLYRFTTVWREEHTTLWRTMPSNKEDRIVNLGWASNGDLARVVFGKKTISPSNLVRTDPRFPGARIFNTPNSRQYRWRPSNNSLDIMLEDSTGNFTAFFRPTAPTRYQLGEVYGELHFLRNASGGTITQPFMDIITVTAMLYRYCEMYRLRDSSSSGSVLSNTGNQTQSSGKITLDKVPSQQSKLEDHSVNLG